MTDTDVQGIIVTNDGVQHHIAMSISDTSGALTIRDLGGTQNELGKYLKGKAITEIRIQLSDGSILTYVIVTQAGRETHHWYGGERLAGSPEVYNLDEKGLFIPVNDQTVITVDVDD